FRAVGPYYQGRVPGSGLTFQEQKLLLPDVIGVEANDKDFRREVEKFYHEILTKIPDAGIELEIGLENDNEPLSESNMPLNIKDYVIYRHIINSPQVAKDKDTADRWGHLKPFYIEDQEKVASEN